MAFVGISGAVVANPVGKRPVAYLVRKDAAQGQIAALDLETPTPQMCAVRFHPFTGETDQRSSLKKIFRVKVFGGGTIPNAPGSAYMVVTADGVRSYVYPYSALSPVPSERLLWAQNTHTIVGYTIDITLYLIGQGIEQPEIMIQYTIVN